MQFVHCPVHTIVVGQASSMASLILAGGASGASRAGSSSPRAREADEGVAAFLSQASQGTAALSRTRPS